MKVNYVDRATRSILSLDYLGENEYKITRISVLAPHRRQGIGSKLLRQCIRDADVGGITLSLEPIPTLEADEDLDTRRAQLISWYEKHGFIQSTHPSEVGFIWTRKPTSHPLMREALASLPALTNKHLYRLAQACIDELMERDSRG